MKWFRDKTSRPPVEALNDVDVDQARQRRREQTAESRDLVDEVAAILFKADPVGINYDDNTDEYEPEAETIVIALPAMTDRDGVATMVHQTFVDWFTLSTAGDRDRYTSVAGDIWIAWRRHQGSVTSHPAEAPVESDGAVTCAYCRKPTATEDQAVAPWEWPGRGLVTNCKSCAGIVRCGVCGHEWDGAEARARNGDPCPDCD